MTSENIQDQVSREYEIAQNQTFQTKLKMERIIAGWVAVLKGEDMVRNEFQVGVTTLSDNIVSKLKVILEQVDGAAGEVESAQGSAQEAASSASQAHDEAGTTEGTIDEALGSLNDASENLGKLIAKMADDAWLK